MREITGVITRTSSENKNGYVWGLLIDNEFIACPRLLELASVLGLNTLAGRTIKITNGGNDVNTKTTGN